MAFKLNKGSNMQKEIVPTHTINFTGDYPEVKINSVYSNHYGRRGIVLSNTEYNNSMIMAKVLLEGLKIPLSFAGYELDVIS